MDLKTVFRGNLGNKMSMYALLYLWKIKYGYDVYITKYVHDHLNYVFENLGKCQNRSLLGSDRDFKLSSCFMQSSNIIQILLYSNSNFVLSTLLCISFDNIMSDIPVAEYSLCVFEKFQKLFK